jgi:hypothetical protein
MIGSKKWLTKFLNTRAGFSDSINVSVRGTPCVVACCGALTGGCWGAMFDSIVILRRLKSLIIKDD